MPDRYDPRNPPRSHGDRRAGDARRGPAVTEDDPLAELAKIVQGRLGSAGASPGRGRGEQQPSASESGGTDLETELLNDLQASFAAVRDGLISPEPPASPPPRAPAPPKAETPRPEHPPATVARDAPPPPPVGPPAPPAAADQPRVRPFEWPVFQPEPESEPRGHTDMRSDIPPPHLVPIPQAQVMQPPVVQRTTPPSPPAEERPSRFVRAAASEPRAEKPVVGEAELRPTLPPESAHEPPLPSPSAAPPRQPHSRWEKPEPLRQPGRSSSRFAPRKAPPAAPDFAFDDEEDVDPFAEGGIFAAAPDIDGDEDLNLDTLADADFTDDEDLPPFADDPFEPAPRRRGPSRTLLIVGGVLAVALVGGVAFATLRPAATSDGVPPIITADNGPTKITPEEPAVPADAEAQNKLIYDRVNSAAESHDTTLVTPDDGPIAPVSDSSSNNPISRIIIPGGPGVDGPGAASSEQGSDAVAALAGQPSGEGTSDAGFDDPVQPIGPRKVRTMVVKPDGTVVSNQVTEVDAPPAAAETAPRVDVATAPPAPVTDDTAAIAGTENLAITPAPPVATSNSAASNGAAQDGTPALTITPDLPAASPPAQAPRSVVASNNPDAPLDLTNGAGGAATEVAAVSGGMLVQVSSQKSEDAARASYRDLQRRYPNILGPYDVNIQRADVPDRGTFFRARVGPFSANDAQRLCDDLKSAGGDCLLASR